MPDLTGGTYTLTVIGIDGRALGVQTFHPGESVRLNFPSGLPAGDVRAVQCLYTSPEYMLAKEIAAKLQHSDYIHKPEDYQPDGPGAV